MKRIIVAGMALILAGTVVFAGGGGDKRSPSSSSPGQGGPKTITWWDHFLPLAPLHQQLWAEYTAKTGSKVEYTQYDPAKQGDALLLAFRSTQCPDVFSYTFGGEPATLYKEGW
ncbi:MAG: hypothetical protein LBD31_03140, partial [Treponema sp.]|nr:hypothetical protein [Treponema sp.]